MLSIFRTYITYLIFYCSDLTAIGTNFLIFPENARDLALGGHVSLGGSASVNPSLIESSPSSALLNINSGQWYGDIRMSALNYVHKVGTYDNKIFVRQAEITDLEFRDDSPSDEPNTTFAAYGMTIGSGLSYQTSFGRFGASISALYFTIYDQHSNGISFDLGYSNVLGNNWGIGIAMLNIGSVSKFYQERPKLPNRFLIGISKDQSIWDVSNRLYLTSESSAFYDSWKIKVGNYSQWKKFRLLGGFSKTKHSSTFSFGSGFVHGRFEITYAMRFGSQDIGIPKNLSLNFELP